MSTSDFIPPEDLLATFEDVDGWKAITLWSGERRICDPCWKWSEEARFAHWTGGYDSFVEPNLCRMHHRRYLRGTNWDEPLRSAPGRPRVNDGSCALDNCDGESFSSGLCKRHYQKDYRASKRAQRERV